MAISKPKVTDTRKVQTAPAVEMPRAQGVDLARVERLAKRDGFMQVAGAIGKVQVYVQRESKTADDARPVPPTPPSARATSDELDVYMTKLTEHKALLAAWERRRDNRAPTSLPIVISYSTSPITRGSDQGTFKTTCRGQLKLANGTVDSAPVESTHISRGHLTRPVFYRRPGDDTTYVIVPQEQADVDMATITRNVEQTIRDAHAALSAVDNARRAEQVKE